VAVALTVDEIGVRSLDVDYNEITWKVRTTTQDVFDYTFQVLRSEGAAGPFEPISVEMDDRYFYIDNFIRKGHDFRTWFYVIRVRNKQTQEFKDYGPADPGPDPDLIATELRKHMNLLFREFIGRRCWVFPVRTFGQRCGCWNRTLGARTQSHCVTCFDTGFVRGYLTPIEAWMSIDPDPKSEQTMSVGSTTQSNTTARMGFFPPVKPRDLIIEPENQRWRVVQVTGTEQLRVTVHQEVQIHKIPITDIEYKIKFDIGGTLSNMWLAPARNFTNPHNFEAFRDDEYPAVLQLYASSYPPVRT
jgi:hypothetical protein